MDIDFRQESNEAMPPISPISRSFRSLAHSSHHLFHVLFDRYLYFVRVELFHLLFAMNVICDHIWRLLFVKCHSANLAYLRIIIGILLLLDMVYERGLSRADTIWGDTNECRFPLFDSLPIPSLQTILAIYALMFIGNVGIIIGFHYKFSCLLYLCCYYYMFVLDKTRWNNHSYLFGLLVLLLLSSDANFQLSLPLISLTDDKRVPFWQYFLIRSQIFLVYFFAGLKKFDSDWLGGHSMYHLSDHWVFCPFKLVLSPESIDLYVVHIGGFIFDLTIGFFLVYPKSRPIAYLLCLAFNLMNSRMFAIGVFPYMMIAVMPVFSAPDWPKRLFFKLSPKHLTESNTQKQDFCDVIQKGNKKTLKKTLKEKFIVAFVILYLTVQVILPNSHWITKGYNTWTNGLYGYSWDMMVHNWRHIHTRITVVDQSSRKFYLNPEAWTKSFRWSHHSDMVKQYALCANRRLTTQFNITEPSIYIDSWISLNGRFAQRVYDPRVDIVKAEWSAFKKPEWVLPVLSHLTDWREKIKKLEQSVTQDNSSNSVIFVADFPGLSLSNYIDSAFDNITLIVMKGWLKVEIEGSNTRIMNDGDRLHLPAQRFHKVTPIRSEPAAYAFILANGTQMQTEVQNVATLTKPVIDSDKYKTILIMSVRHLTLGLKALLEIINELSSTLFKRFFICLNMCLF